MNKAYDSICRELDKILLDFKEKLNNESHHEFEYKVINQYTDYHDCEEDKFATTNRDELLKRILEPTKQEEDRYCILQIQSLTGKTYIRDIDGIYIHLTPMFEKNNMRAFDLFTTVSGLNLIEFKKNCSGIRTSLSGIFEMDEANVLNYITDIEDSVIKNMKGSVQRSHNIGKNPSDLRKYALVMFIFSGLELVCIINILSSGNFNNIFEVFRFIVIILALPFTLLIGTHYMIARNQDKLAEQIKNIITAIKKHLGK